MGPVPAPLVLLGAALAAGYLLARLLSLHAGWLGGRWAARITATVRADVRRTLDEAAFSHLDRLEAARDQIAAAVAAGYSTRP